MVKGITVATFLRTQRNVTSGKLERSTNHLGQPVSQSKQWHETKRTILIQEGSKPIDKNGPRPIHCNPRNTVILRSLLRDKSIATLHRSHSAEHVYRDYLLIVRNALPSVWITRSMILEKQWSPTLLPFRIYLGHVTPTSPSSPPLPARSHRSIIPPSFSVPPCRCLVQALLFAVRVRV